MLRVNGFERSFDLAIKEIGVIEPWWSDENQLFVFEHPAYPRVTHADTTKQKTKNGYIRALKGFIQEHLDGTLAPEAERATSGQERSE